MKNSTILLLLLLLACPLFAEEITVDGLIAAHKAGLSSQTLNLLVSDENNTITPTSEAELGRLSAAGVPQPVIEVFSKRSRTAEPAEATPDNPELKSLVKLVESGISEKIIMDQIAQTGVSKKPSMVDLIYLKEKKVPELVIVALMNAEVIGEQVAGKPALASPAAAPAVAPAVAPKNKTSVETNADEDNKHIFEGLIYEKTFRGRPGKMVIEDGKLLWRDANKGKHSFDMFINGIKSMRLVGSPQDAEMFYFRVVIEFTRGQNYTFEDANKDTGGNENLTAFIDHMKANYPDIEYVEKSK